MCRFRKSSRGWSSITHHTLEITLHTRTHAHTLSHKMSSSPSCCRSRCDKDCFYHLTIALHLSLCCECDVHESVFLSLSFRFSWWYPWTGDERALSFCDQKTVESREPAFGSLSGDILMGRPVHREILYDQKIFHGSPVRSSMSLLYVWLKTNVNKLCIYPYMFDRLVTQQPSQSVPRPIQGRREDIITYAIVYVPEETMQHPKTRQCNLWQITHERTNGAHDRWEIPARGPPGTTTRQSRSCNRSHNFDSYS